jgi:alcohol dehydrogenase (quinone), cytochrome c subunit
MLFKNKLGLAAVILLIVIATVAIVVNRVPTSPFASTSGVPPIPAAQAEYVARLGDCVACHSVSDGKPFAGGLKMGTPLGVVYSTNITPDNETGIGNYTLAEFDNAVRRGVARGGRRLYPVMPYPSYAKMSDQDVMALYAYFMHVVRPVHQPNQHNELKWPLDIRWPLALWNLEYLDDQSYRVKSAFDATWNRGAYLVQGLGHCGACHTPRGVAFQEKALDESSDQYLSGALLDGWMASSLRDDSRAGLGRWPDQDIVELLATGRNSHATVFGSMMDAFNNSTQYMSDADLAAIAHYLKTLASPRGTERQFVARQSTEMALNAGDFSARGSGLYFQQCGFCHGLDGGGHGKLLPPLAGNPTVISDDPSSVINIVLNGAGRIVTRGVPDSYRMPPFRALLSDYEIADLVNFVRDSWGNEAPAVSSEAVKSLRSSTDSTNDQVVILKMR